METEPLPALPSGTLRGIYVTPPEFAESIAPLLAHRGPGHILLNPDTAYDIYAHGQESPDAIREALAALIDAAPNRVEFPAVVLVGHGTFDRRDYLGLITAPQIPIYIDESVDTSITIENCVDFPYGLLFGDDDFQDVQLTRIPAMTTAELDHIVSRTLTFEALAPDLSEEQRPALFVYDTDPAFLLDRPLWTHYWDQLSRPLREVLIDTGAGWPANRASLFDKLEEEPNGPAFVMYIGHGNNNVWANSNFLHRVNIPDIDTRDGYPFVTTFTCLNSYFAFPGASARSLAESWILAPIGRGASASFAPCSVDYYNAQKVKTEEFMKLMADVYRPDTVGEIVTRARIGFTLRRPELMITNREYLLFGDAGSPTTIPGISVNSVPDWMDF